MQNSRSGLFVTVGLVLLLAVIVSALRIANALSVDSPLAESSPAESPSAELSADRSPLSTGKEERPVTTLTAAVPNWPVLARGVAANEIRPPTGDRYAVFTLAVVNTAQDPAKLRFNTGQRYDFLVIDGQGREIWRWSKSRAFIQMLSEVTAAPRQLFAYTVVWDGKDDDGKPIAAGEYWVQGVLTTDPWAATQPVRFTWHGN
ncbi:MAG: BsuPI-related putative proteinase inhibitor [Bacteroidota bacterium]